MEREESETNDGFWSTLHALHYCTVPAAASDVVLTTCPRFPSLLRRSFTHSLIHSSRCYICDGKRQKEAAGRPERGSGSGRGTAGPGHALSASAASGLCSPRAPTPARPRPYPRRRSPFIAGDAPTFSCPDPIPMHGRTHPRRRRLRGPAPPQVSFCLEPAASPATENKQCRRWRLHTHGSHTALLAL